MADNYAALAPVYRTIGLAGYAAEMTPRLLSFAQQNDWLGRRVLDIGCGTGETVTWLAERGYSVTGVDRSVEMLEQSQQLLNTKGLNANLVEGDIRTLQLDDSFDLVFALDVLNDLDNLRDMETVFGHVNAVLTSNRYFLFDLQTLQGLARSGEAGDAVIYDSDELVVFSQTTYDYERQTHRARYDIFQRENETSWSRSQAEHISRAYPIQAIATLVRRQKFEVLAVVDLSLRPFDISEASASRVIFLTKKI